MEERDAIECAIQSTIIHTHLDSFRMRTKPTAVFGTKTKRKKAGKKRCTSGMLVDERNIDIQYVHLHKHFMKLKRQSNDDEREQSKKTQLLVEAGKEEEEHHK